MNGNTDERERQAFVHWLRTGRLLPDAGELSPQWKFNPWHDPADGRFTVRDGGRYFGSGREPRRETMGGAGATGSWPAPAKPRQPAKLRQPGSPDKRHGLPHPKPVAAAAVAEAANGQDGGPRTRHLRNGYRYDTDRLHRTRYVDAHIKLGQASPRSRLAQARAGGVDRRPGDDGGHYIVHRFNGPGDSFNHFAQSARFNRGTYRALEDGWARALRAGEAVRVQIAPTYVGSSQRPTGLDVTWTVKGHTKSKHFPN